MTQRLIDTMKLFWCILIIYSGPVWSPVRCVTVRNPPKNPTTVEAQAKFFQDFFSVQLSPYKIEFGHVCEDPNTWEQRYEKKDFKNHRDMGKVTDFLFRLCLISSFLSLSRFAWLRCRYKHLPTHEDYDQGHRLGNERHFTERHERARPSTGLFSAKVRWGDKKGGYGEHYWDLNHAGHTGNDGDDGYSDDGSYHGNDGSYHGNDGSYHGDDGDDSFDEPSEQSPKYQPDEYDSETASKYDENSRAKRAHTKTKNERIESKKHKHERPQKPTNINEQLADKQSVDEYVAEASDEKETYQDTPKQKGSEQHFKRTEEEQAKEKDHIVLVVNQKEKENKEISNQYVPQQIEPKHYVPYEGGAGIRQHQHPEITAASAPRLFLEPTTGRVIDRTTGQAYVLQPLIQKSNYS